MLRLLLLIPGLALLAVGGLGLASADPDSGSDFMIAGGELIAGIALIGLAFVVSGRAQAPPQQPQSGESDRAEVLERLRRHTDAFRLAEDGPRDLATAEPAHDAIPAERGGHFPAHVRAGARQQPESRPGAAGLHPAPAEDEAAARAREEIRMPPLMLLNVPGDASAAEIESAPPLGTRDDVLARLREIVPDLDVDANGRSEHAGPKHAIRLDLGADTLVHTIVIEAAGETGISIVRWLLESTGWRAFMPRNGQFVEPDALESFALRESR